MRLVQVRTAVNCRTVDLAVRARSRFGASAGGLIRAPALVDANLYRIIVFGVVLDERHAFRGGAEPGGTPRRTAVQVTC
jgi:hypothetical protein